MGGTPALVGDGGAREGGIRVREIVVEMKKKVYVPVFCRKLSAAVSVGSYTLIFLKLNQNMTDGSICRYLYINFF